MAIYKDKKRGTWYVSLFYRDATGKRLHKMKRGFRTRKEAQVWEKGFLDGKEDIPEMSFEEVTQLYFENMRSRLRKTTVQTKEYVIKGKILPFFKDKNIYEITPADVRDWQNNLLQRGYAETYLRTIQEQLTAIFNFAIRYYDLPKNPILAAGSIGKDKAREMEIWTVEEFYKFIAVFKDEPMKRIGFLILFWTGLRLGEMLALTIADIDFVANTVRVTKTLNRIHGYELITEPKTPKSRRIVSMPDVLVREVRKYIAGMINPTNDSRLVTVSKLVMEREIHRGARLAGVKDIHVHCLRHSHTALIGSLGATPVEAAERLGHENVQTTLNVYSHVLPGWQTEFMKELDKAYMNYAGTDPSDAEDPDDLEDMKGLDDPEDPGDLDGSDFYVI